ncbi:hypothetical protein L6452_04462 [Arctium lappa]|uniref:Uncharacterized protein n=1 Tax=Arctium lappa TaxID=4217 RepID=A0ACB9EDK5_ARCLA|nr:hypothetical protein L6452_04462 [Arctium lappa]
MIHNKLQKIWTPYHALKTYANIYALIDNVAVRNLFGEVGLYQRSTSPSRISVRGGYLTSSPSVRFSIDHRHKSPDRSIAASSSRNLNRNCDRDGNKKAWSHGSKKTCLCSLTTHLGSFRCSLHKNSSMTNSNDSHDSTVSYRSHKLYAQRSAMTNSLVRIGTVEGDLVKRALAALIRPSSHQQRRRSDFQPRPSRLSVMSKADE